MLKQVCPRGDERAAITGLAEEVEATPRLRLLADAAMGQGDAEDRLRLAIAAELAEGLPRSSRTRPPKRRCWRRCTPPLMAPNRMRPLWTVRSPVTRLSARRAAGVPATPGTRPQLEDSHYRTVEAACNELHLALSWHEPAEVAEAIRQAAERR